MPLECYWCSEGGRLLQFIVCRFLSCGPLLTQRCFQCVPCHHQESSLCFSSFVTIKIKMSMDFQCIQMPGIITRSLVWILVIKRLFTLYRTVLNSMSESHHLLNMGNQISWMSRKGLDKIIISIKSLQPSQVAPQVEAYLCSISTPPAWAFCLWTDITLQSYKSMIIFRGGSERFRTWQLIRLP